MIHINSANSTADYTPNPSPPSAVALSHRDASDERFYGIEPAVETVVFLQSAGAGAGGGRARRRRRRHLVGVVAASTLQAVPHGARAHCK